MDLKISIDDVVYSNFLNNNYSRDDIIAVHTAINNAEQELCDYAVSREAVRDILAKYHLEESRVTEELNELPPVTQKSGKWIPVSEGLPKESKTVIASTEYGVFPEARYTTKYGWEWAYESGADYWMELKGVEAWMPLPTRYEPQERKDKDDHFKKDSLQSVTTF